MSAAKPATAGAAGAAPPASRLGALWESAIGRKALMAASGLVLFGWLVGHLLGNLLAFEGEERLDGYAEFLRSVPALLWTARLVLLAAALVHVVAALQLWVERRRARPVAYAQWRATGSSLASRTMLWSGALVLGFAVYHLLDLTFGPANPDFREGEVFHNLVASLGRAAAAGFYVVAVAGLGVHLWHGLWSMFQSLGLASRGAMTGMKRSAAVLAVVTALGFAAVPLAVLLGVVGG
jgi:succinate dehydrogenase / fumarate reductase cytochrome b subunit